MDSRRDSRKRSGVGILLFLVAWVLVDTVALLVWAASQRALPGQQPLPAGSVPAPRAAADDDARHRVSAG